MDRQFIKGEDGENQFVILPINEWEAIQDIMDAREVRARIDAGEETFPAEVAEKIAAGVNPVKVFRQYRGLSQGALAAEAGITQAMVSEIETGVRNGGMKSMKGLAKALDLDMDDLI